MQHDDLPFELRYHKILMFYRNGNMENENVLACCERDTEFVKELTRKRVPHLAKRGTCLGAFGGVEENRYALPRPSSFCKRPKQDRLTSPHHLHLIVHHNRPFLASFFIRRRVLEFRYLHVLIANLLSGAIQSPGILSRSEQCFSLSELA